ncbi:MULTISPECIES: hypothetical protein [unclassified Microcoleus]|uniref:hypothetical protein n=1 Tax=unclassified Microcoleus TaxID=2642155 RepID=UPI002FD38CE7
MTKGNIEKHDRITAARQPKKILADKAVVLHLIFLKNDSRSKYGDMTMPAFATPEANTTNKFAVSV